MLQEGRAPDAAAVPLQAGMSMHGKSSLLCYNSPRDGPNRKRIHNTEEKSKAGNLTAVPIEHCRGENFCAGKELP